MSTAPAPAEPRSTTLALLEIISETRGEVSYYLGDGVGEPVYQGTLGRYRSAKDTGTGKPSVYNMDQLRAQAWRRQTMAKM